MAPTSQTLPTEALAGSPGRVAAPASRPNQSARVSDPLPIVGDGLAGAAREPSVERPSVGQQAAPPGREAPATPFDAALDTILYSSDRKLAIIDGRIVQVGDTVRGARIVDINQTAVLLRDGRGQLRQLALGGIGR